LQERIVIEKNIGHSVAFGAGKRLWDSAPSPYNLIGITLLRSTFGPLEQRSLIASVKTQNFESLVMVHLEIYKDKALLEQGGSGTIGCSSPFPKRLKGPQVSHDLLDS